MRQFCVAQAGEIPAPCSDPSVSIEVQLSEPVFRQFQQALDQYSNHSADSLFAEAITQYLAILEILETAEQQEQFQRLIKLLESCCLSLLQPQQFAETLIRPNLK